MRLLSKDIWKLSKDMRKLCKEMWEISTKMRVLNVNFDKWIFWLKTSKSSKQRAKAKFLHSDNQHVSK